MQLRTGIPIRDGIHAGSYPIIIAMSEIIT